jgi:exopolyphosphatase/guanosine-5'-triphosphate,3'-diphosphate pyrophosphatase
MRLGVLDVGSNTVHLLVVDAHPGARPWPAYSRKNLMQLTRHLDGDGCLDEAGADNLVRFVRESLEVAEDQGVEDLVAFATSAVREAHNGEDVLRRVRAEAGADLEVLSGYDEARLTFLAVRRWFGWSSGRLLVLDIGGGSLEIAVGIDEEPDVARSLPLGAARLTRTWLPDDPPSSTDVRALRKHIRAEIAREVRAVSIAGQPDRVVGTSKSFRSLARIAGAAASGEGPHVRRRLAASDMHSWAEKLSRLSVAQRAALPGVSANRAPQLLAGALVAEAAMDLFGVKSLDICPWALREGIILRRLDWMQRE